MKVSVIVPVYNTEKYLKQCLDSLVHQTLQDLEVLLVDDGSTDGSGEILDEYGREYPDRVRVFHKENGGQASARNLALEHAQGEYLGYVDSDDWVDLNMYEEMLHTIEQEGADLAVCDMIDHFSDGTTVLHTFTQKDRCVFWRSSSACTKLFSRKLVKDFRFPVGRWYEDFQYTGCALMTAPKIAYVPHAFYHCHCRREEGSTMYNNNAIKNLDIIAALDGIRSFAREQGIEEERQDDLTLMAIDHILITSINRVALQNHPKREEVIKQLRNYVKTQFPDWKRSRAFGEMPRNRRIVASLNAMGLHKLSKLLIQGKARASA